MGGVVSTGSRGQSRITFEEFMKTLEVGIIRPDDGDKSRCSRMECSKVMDHVYLGGDSVAKNKDMLRENGITNVLNSAGVDCLEYFKDDLVYKTLWLEDSYCENITSVFYDVFDYIEDVRQQGGRILVYCMMGVSRSASLVIAYVMWREKLSFVDAYQYVISARKIASPNTGFIYQLTKFEERIHVNLVSSSSVLRMYRMGPHSSYDPLHLIPKTLRYPSPYVLDTRGAFIIQSPSVIYVWIGKNCESIMEKDGKGAALQVVWYEKVQGPVITIEEGKEPPNFWNAFSGLPPLMDKSGCGVQDIAERDEAELKIGPGERKLDLYDEDFECFQNAIKGDVVYPFSTLRTGHEINLAARESNWSGFRARSNSHRLDSVSKTLSRAMWCIPFRHCGQDMKSTMQ